MEYSSAVISRVLVCFFLLNASAYNEPAYAQDLSAKRSTQAEGAANSMSKESVATELQALAQYAIDEFFILQQAKNELKNTEIGKNVVKFQEECETHIATLSTLTRQYGGEVPIFEKDFKGVLGTVYVQLLGMIDDKNIMDALQTNLKIILKAYETALERSPALPNDVKDKVTLIRDDTKKYLSYA